MIVYHKNKEIDREQWDNCIRNSSCVKPYPYSWYLDIMSPGWEALVDDDYDSVFPIPAMGRFGIQYISTPSFLQHLGAFSPDKPTEKAIVEFLYYLPDFYRYVDLNIAQNVDPDGFKVTEKFNYELDLSKSYEKLREGFTAQCRKNIESAEKRSVLVSEISPDELIDAFILQKTKEMKEISARDFQKLKNLMNFCIKNKKGRILGVRGSRKKVIHGIFVIEIHGCRTIQFMVNTPKSREKHLEYFSVNELIRHNAGTKATLDLSGAGLVTEPSFSESFGAVKIPYYRVYRNRLLWPVRILK
jgi:hypothetical protein